MDLASIVAIAGPYGPLGLFCAYLAWQNHKRDARDDAREKRLEQILKDNAEADKQTAIALTLLAERVGG